MYLNGFKLKRLAYALSLVLMGTGLSGCGDEGFLDRNSDSDGSNSIVDTTPSTIAEYTLVWSDEFNSASLDTSKWTIEEGYGPNNDGWGNNESQLYTTSADNLSIVADASNAENSFLSIVARCDSGNCGVRDGSITSAKVNTKDKFEFKYGKVQARIQVPDGKSTWPAFWLLGANYPETVWPNAGEIDILEMHQFYSDNKTAHSAMHWFNDGKTPEPGLESFTQYRTFDAPLTNQFHVFELEWNERQVTGKIDGIAYFTKVIDPATMSEFYKKFYMILNLAIDGTLGGPPEAIKTAPQKMLVDWVRVYQKTKPDSVSIMPDDTAVAADSVPFGRVVNSVEYGGNSVLADMTVTDPTPEVGETVLKLDYTSTNAFFSGAAFEYNSLDISNYNTLTFKVDTNEFPEFNDISVEFVDSRNTGDATGKKSVLMSQYLVNSGSTTAARAGNWKTYEIPLSVFSGVNLDDIRLFGFWNPINAEGALIRGVLYIDDIRLLNKDSNTVDPNPGTGMSPATAAPSPSQGAGDVISIYSDAYTNIDEIDYNPGWGQSTIYATEQVDGNELIKLTSLNYQGIDFSKNQQDLSNMTVLHFDIWTPDDIPSSDAFKVKLVDFGPNGDYEEANGDDSDHELTLGASSTPSLTKGSWVSYDIPLSDFSGLTNKANIAQLVFSGALSTVYFDNIYFHNGEGNSNTGGGDGLDPGFEGVASSYTFTDFSGGVASVVDNPKSGGINTSTKVGKMVKNAGDTWAGSTLSLGNPLDFTEGEVFTLKIWSSYEVPVTFKLEGSDMDTEVVVNHSGSGEWEELTFDFSGGTSVLGEVTGLTLIFDNGVVGAGEADPEKWTFYFDDLAQKSGGSSNAGVTLPVGFESDSLTYNWTDFDGGAASVIDNPQPSGNDSAKVAQLVKGEGATWAGSLLTLGSPIDFSQGEVFTLNFWSASEKPVLLKFEGSAGNAEITATHNGGSAWQSLSFDFSGQTAGLGDVVKVVMIVDNGVAGDGSAAWTFYADDIAQTSGGGTTLEQVSLPVSFNATDVDYSVTDFGGASSELITDPVDATNKVIQTTKTNTAQTWAGTTIGPASGTGFPSGVPFAAGSTSMTVRVYSPDANIKVRLKVEDHNDPTITVETDAYTTQANTWETLTFDFSNAATNDGNPTAALDMTKTYDKASIFFNFGTTGADAGEKVYLWDDVSFVN